MVDYHKFHVALILEDVTVTAAQLGMSEWLSYSVKCSLNIVPWRDRPEWCRPHPGCRQTLQYPVFVVVRIRIALPGRRFSIHA